MQKILIIQTAFIGDVVLATSIVEKLHQHFPDASIDFLVRKGNESLFTDHPFLHEVLVWNKKENKLKNLFNLLFKIRKTKYDVVINVQRYGATGLLTAFSGAKATIGFDKNPFSFLFIKKIKHVFDEKGNGKHEIERNFELIKDLTDNIIVRPKLYPSKNDEEKTKIYKQRPYITVAPASVWFTKQYPADKWISFINKLPENLNVYLLGAPPDKIISDNIIGSTINKNVIDLCGKLSFLESCSLMKDALMNYVNDSAPMHFASAVNAPVSSIFCSTIPAFGYGPLSDKKFIIEIQEQLYCRPCGLHGYKACPEKHFRCAKEITDEQLLSTLTSTN
ncbi:MAG TPA: glycosyltransferase family 9 protein [Puia sp.]|nr:glycosyltransferase family 9 protein [Puia sp.]